MNILIIPDIHCRKFWREAIVNNIGNIDKIVFLGDYLDPYPNEIDENPESIEMNDFYDVNSALNMLNDIVSLKKNEPNKYILLCGNHSCHYIWSKFSAASRIDNKNWEKYHKFFLENLEYFNLVYIQDNVIFSHAGITEGWAQRVWNKLEYPKDELSSVMEIAVMFQDTPLSDFNEYYIKLIGDISHYRYGDMFYGSCEWADLREHIDMKTSINNIIPKGENGIFQVFGHTQLKEPFITKKWACLDCKKGFIINTKSYEITEC